MRYSFETYEPTNDSQTRALTVARKVSEIAVANYAADQPSSPAIVVFSGAPGTGKTHLIESIKNSLNEQGVQFDSFSGQIPPAHHKLTSKIVLGDDSFSTHDRLSGHLASASRMELVALNARVLDEWYPNGALVVLSSNFDLVTIQEELRVVDTIGRASSRLDEMARRGADVPIVGQDRRAEGEVESLF